ncbi:MAG: hypothetical protein ABL872_05330 [Lacibacter sp.]
MKQKMVILVIYFLLAGNLSFPVTKACDNGTKSIDRIIVQKQKQKTVNSKITAELFPLASIMFNNQNL